MLLKALFRTLHNSLRAMDQFGSNIVTPLSVDGTGLAAEHLDFGRRKMGYVHLIDFFQHVDDHRGILQSLPRLLLLHGHHYDPPPLKWSDLRYVFDIQEDCNGKEAIQA